MDVRWLWSGVGWGPLLCPGPGCSDRWASGAEDMLIADTSGPPGKPYCRQPFLPLCPWEAVLSPPGHSVPEVTAYGWARPVLAKGCLGGTRLLLSTAPSGGLGARPPEGLRCLCQCWHVLLRALGGVPASLLAGGGRPCTLRGLEKVAVNPSPCCCTAATEMSALASTKQERRLAGVPSVLLLWWKAPRAATGSGAPGAACRSAGCSQGDCWCCCSAGLKSAGCRLEHCDVVLHRGPVIVSFWRRAHF